MNASLTALDTQKTLKISIGSGIEDWQNGEIVLVVRGDGRVDVENRRSGQDRHYSAQHGSDRIRAFGQFMAEHHLQKFASASPTMTVPPGDVPVWFRVEDGDKLLVEARLWHSQRYDNDDLDAILEYSDELIEEVTGGALPFGKPSS